LPLSQNKDLLFSRASLSFIVQKPLWNYFKDSGRQRGRERFFVEKRESADIIKNKSVPGRDIFSKRTYKH